MPRHYGGPHSGSKQRIQTLIATERMIQDGGLQRFRVD